MGEVELYDLEYAAKIKDSIDGLLDDITQQLMKGEKLLAMMTARKLMSETVHLQRVIHETTFDE